MRGREGGDGEIEQGGWRQRRLGEQGGRVTLSQQDIMFISLINNSYNLFTAGKWKKPAKSQPGVSLFSVFDLLFLLNILKQDKYDEE